MRTRLIILVLVTAVCMVAVIYVWYLDLQATLKQGFRAENNGTVTSQAQDAQKQNEVSNATPGFIASLVQIVKDFNIGWDWSRFSVDLSRAQSVWDGARAYVSNFNIKELFGK